MVAAQKAEGFAVTTPKERGLIFVVDDEVMIGEVVEAILNMEGFESRFFSDPLRALKAVTESERKPDVLLSDYVMNPMNGMELIQRCKAMVPGLKTILYSGNVGEEITRLYSIKPDAFMAKPFLPKRLVGLVQKMLAEIAR